MRWHTERKTKELEAKERNAARQREQDKAKGGGERRRQEEEASSRRANAGGAAGGDGGEEEVEVPHEYLCPITMDLMREPVIAMDGHTYDRCLIEFISHMLSCGLECIKSSKSTLLVLLPGAVTHLYHCVS
jgi:hypothetical protein